MLTACASVRGRVAAPAAQAALDASIYEVRSQRATDQERRYMRAMAALGSGPYRSGDVATKLGRKTSEVSMIRQRLLDKGLVYATEDYGYVDFTVPRYGEFMARYMPTGLAERESQSPPSEASLRWNWRTNGLGDERQRVDSSDKFAASGILDGSVRCAADHREGGSRT